MAIDRFKTLKARWDKKLADSGFRDAEEFRNGEVVLKQQASNVYRGADEITREAKLEYFLQVSTYIHQTKFRTKIEEFILLQYADGKTRQETINALKKKGVKRTRQTLWRVLNRYLKQWGMKT